MRYQITWLIGAILVGLSLLNLTAALDPENAEPLTLVSNGMSQFSTEFYKISSENEANNLICSPSSAGIVLSMAAYGARGNTEKQMKSGLHLPENDAVGKEGYQSLIDTLNGLKSARLRLAQKIYVADNFEINPEFKDMTDNNFRSPMEALDFNKADEASQTINGWCAQKTNNRIREIVTADDVSGASIVLVNAIYFKGVWNAQFDEDETESEPFHIDEKTTKNVDMMFKRHTYNYGTLPDLDAVFVELPYKKLSESDSISMFIILPNTITGLKKAEESLNKVNFKEVHTNHHMTPINLSVPKFKIESTLQLQPTLEKLGMTDMFQDTADFTGITEAPPLKVTKVIQKAFISIDEKGSEAAAATAVMGMARSGATLNPAPVTVTVDRPFFYAIVHPATNTVLFQGHITDPKYDEV
ncbi:ovalbumin-related protein X [Microplitis demolitor]|uniref:ovalbumin-related protein X n=1 Tax=Microplitis demolitor TaxID=69319 RepID=UPI0004CD5083|nr:ovalbumin-related protein X [Microplitis demolitor]